VDASFGAGVRRVHLEGQALFRVTHDASRPFLVHAGGTVAEDLGTEFEVRAYATEPVVRVIVAEGSVALRRESGDSAAILRPRDVARLGTAGSVVVLHDQNIDRMLAWTSGQLNFDDAPLSQVAEELQRWFDVECRIADPALAGSRYSGPFFADSLDAGLQALDMAMAGVRVERRGRVVTFSAGTSVLPTARPNRIEAGA
jgi:transmembrane sensor